MSLTFSEVGRKCTFCSCKYCDVSIGSANMVEHSTAVLPPSARLNSTQYIKVFVWNLHVFGWFQIQMGTKMKNKDHINKNRLKSTNLFSSYAITRCNNLFHLNINKITGIRENLFWI
jgi:hypothetical protein